MKRFPFLSAVAALVLVVTLASCTTLSEMPDEGYDDGYRGSRGVYNDPYYSSNDLVLVRDGRTGRYYYVNRYDLYPSSRYGSAYSDRYYNDRYYNDRYNRNGYYYRTNPTRNTGPTQEQRQESQRKIQDSKDRILKKGS